MSTMVRHTTIYGQVVLELNLICKKCNRLLEWKDGNYGHDEIFVSPCANCNEMKIQSEKLNSRLSELDWDVGVGSVRIIRTLESAGIITVNDVLQKSRIDLWRIPNIGRKSFRELEKQINSLGFKIKENQ